MLLSLLKIVFLRRNQKLFHVPLYNLPMAGGGCISCAVPGSWLAASISQALVSNKTCGVLDSLMLASHSYTPVIFFLIVVLKM